jgi:hypothetical protein
VRDQHAPHVRSNSPPSAEKRRDISGTGTRRIVQPSRPKSPDHQPISADRICTGPDGGTGACASDRNGINDKDIQEKPYIANTGFGAFCPAYGIAIAAVEARAVDRRAADGHKKRCPHES